MKNTKKIAYIITLPDLGGAQSHVYEVMTHIGEYGMVPLLITGKDGWLVDQVTAAGIKTYIVPALIREISPIKDMKAVLAVRRILKAERPDILHCHSSKAGIIGRVAARTCRIPSIFTAHGWAFTDGVSFPKRFIYRNIENLIAYITDQIICVSEYDCQLGLRYLPAHKDKIMTIHNCIPDLPQYVRDWDNQPLGDTIHCVVVARFAAPKRNIEILHILRKLLDAGSKITVTFIGDGPDMPRAKEEAARLHLGSNAIFLGARSDVASLLPNYDLFLLLSNWEGFPISILEAMRAGLPVVASDVGGVKEAVDDKVTGLLLKGKANELSYFADMLDEGRESIRGFGISGRICFLNKFTLKKMLVRLCSIYMKL